MKVVRSAPEYRHLRAPQEDGGLFIDPPIGQVAECLEGNIALRGGGAASAVEAGWLDYDFQGRRLGDLVRQARVELLAAAWAYTAGYRDVAGLADPADAATLPIILAGHQPQLCHPGVWCKNFLASRLAAQHGGVAINLLIDSDIVTDTSVRVPGGSLAQPVVRSVPLDTPRAPVPYEECRVRDRDLFTSFGTRAAQVLAPVVGNPLLTSYWPRVVERARETDNLGLCLAQARHQLEGDWGLATLEMPQSQVCQLESFCWFAAHLLAQLPRFFEIYNSSAAECRRINRIRSSAHPVPDLVEKDGWLEAPFWIWDSRDPKRRPLFVASRGDDMLLSDRRDVQVTLRLTPDMDADTAAAQLGELTGRGIRLRSRALITTMFARLLLGDLFIHGIGGAKYDQLTDLLIERFFAVPPPRFLTLSATLRLPVPCPCGTAEQLRDVAWQLRQRQYHPEKYLPAEGANDTRRWVKQKNAWIATPQVRENARRRCRAIRLSNEMLQPALAGQIAQLYQRRDSLHEALRHEAILASREYPFCFFPENFLRNYLLDILSKPL